MTNTETIARTDRGGFDTPLTPRVLAARAAAQATPTVLPEREIFIPGWLAILITVAILAAVFAAGLAVGRAVAPAATVGHTVSCAVAGGPVCTRNTVLDPAGNN